MPTWLRNLGTAGLMTSAALVLLGFPLTYTLLWTLVAVGLSGLLVMLFLDSLTHELHTEGRDLVHYVLVLVGFPLVHWLTVWVVGLLNLQLQAWLPLLFAGLVVVYLAPYLSHLGAPEPTPERAH